VSNYDRSKGKFGGARIGIESDGRDITMIECRVVLTAAKSPSTSSPAA
jgi:hypothetical protein